MQNWEQRKIFTCSPTSEALLAVPLPHVADVRQECFQILLFQTHPADKLFQRNLIQAFQCSFKTCCGIPFKSSTGVTRAIQSNTLTNRQVHILQYHRRGPYSHRPGYQANLLITLQQREIKIQRTIIITNQQIAIFGAIIHERTFIHSPTGKKSVIGKECFVL